MPVSLSRAKAPIVSPATDTRSAILAAALAILQREGAGAMTVRSVATAAGCSTTGVYTWLGGKGGLVEAIFIDGFENFGETLNTARRQAPSDRLLIALAETYRAWALAHPTQYMVMFGRAVPDYEPSEHAQTVSLATFDDMVASTSATMSAIGLGGNPVDIAFYLWAGIHGHVSLELAGMDLAADETERAARFQRDIQRLLRGCML